MHTALSYDIGIGCIQHRVLSTDRDDAYSIEYGVLIQITDTDYSTANHRPMHSKCKHTLDGEK